MYLGLDIGTSTVKALLVDDEQGAVGQESAALDVQRPQPLWSEQDPEAWWQAVLGCIETLRRKHPVALGAVRGIGLSGQMHGAVLLDAGDCVLRPAILWNDGRSAAQCSRLLEIEPRTTEITGNLVMPGFTAPKLLWVREHEPDIFRRVRRVLLPKDFVRLRLSGEHVSDMSDAAGTLWLDVGQRRWSPHMLTATGLDEAAMPRLTEGCWPSATLLPPLANQWGMSPGVVVAGGGGDNAAGAVGVGCIEPGQAMLSLGTSGVLFASSKGFSPHSAQAVHTFCHCLPDTWHHMAVTLSAASCLTWVTAATGAASEAELLVEIEAADRDASSTGCDVVFLPYLAGERTPHNDPHAKGVFFGLTHATRRADLGRAVLEGVAFALADGRDAMRAAGTELRDVWVIGGGARSRFWSRILASALDTPLLSAPGAELGPAFGAARLARLAVLREETSTVCKTPVPAAVAHPDAELVERYRERRVEYQQLYRALRGVFRGSAEVVSRAGCVDAKREGAVGKE